MSFSSPNLGSHVNWTAWLNSQLSSPQATPRDLSIVPGAPNANYRGLVRDSEDMLYRSLAANDEEGAAAFRSLGNDRVNATSTPR